VIDIDGLTDVVTECHGFGLKTKYGKDLLRKTRHIMQLRIALNNKLLRGVLENGFERPSPVQEESIPHILMGNNVLCHAKNGTGKTGAYAIPMLQLIDINVGDIQALVLVPKYSSSKKCCEFAPGIKDRQRQTPLSLCEWCHCGGHGWFAGSAAMRTVQRMAAMHTLTLPKRKCYANE